MKLLFWIKAARLRTLPLALSCILMGASLAIINDFNLDTYVFTLTLITTVLLQVLSNYANDYGDGVKGTDINRKNSDRMVQSGKISSKQMLLAIIIVSILTLISGTDLLLNVFNDSQILVFLIFLIVGLLAIMSAIKYTVGKGAYGYRGLGDLFVFIFFGIVGVLGSYFLFSQKINFLPFLGALFTGSLSCAVLNMNNLRDFKNDKISNKNTLVVYLGVQKAKYYHYSLIITAIISLIAIIYFSNNQLLWITCIPFAALTKHIVFVRNNNDLEKFDGQLKVVALSCFFSCLILLLCCIIT
jgi:1,4-dihydroxy-2-naphthoate octaprenyltransferase